MKRAKGKRLCWHTNLGLSNYDDAEGFWWRRCQGCGDIIKYHKIQDLSPWIKVVMWASTFLLGAYVGFSIYMMFKGG